MGKKIANYVSEKGLRSKINRTTTTTTIFKRAEDLNRNVSKKDT